MKTVNLTRQNNETPYHNNLTAVHSNVRSSTRKHFFLFVCYNKFTCFKKFTKNNVSLNESQQSTKTLMS